MRLLHTTDLVFKDFSEKDIPLPRSSQSVSAPTKGSNDSPNAQNGYAILSHRWIIHPENQEVSYNDFIGGLKRDTKGYEKIKRACARAKGDNIDWMWIDTCCIDKSSSAELSEAINSMYQWYRRSAICYVFLADVSANATDEYHDTMEPEVRASVWFERGWTLQELLAPQHVVFFNQQWEYLGTKRSLSRVLTSRTGIDAAILDGKPLYTRSIAQRMAWAAHRKTERIEDVAYSLLGIFDVNMPLLYGEGEKAFFRLQEEIIKQSDDHSIFTWPIKRTNQPGLLAASPTAFENCQGIRSMTSRKGRSAYSLTNRGLNIRLLATQWLTDTYLVQLDCADGDGGAEQSDAPEELRIGMFLRRLGEDDQYARVESNGETLINFSASTWDREALRMRNSKRPVELIEVNVRQQVAEADGDFSRDRVNGFRIATPELLVRDKSGKDRFQARCAAWDVQSGIMDMDPGGFGTVGILDMSEGKMKIKAIKLGFDFNYNPVCFLATSGGLTEEIRVFDKAGKFDMGAEDESSLWHAQELAQFKSIYQREPFDVLAWSEISYPRGSLGEGAVANELKFHRGLWAVKGDRINGLDVRIGLWGALRIVRADFKGKLVWDVHLDNPKESGSSIRKMFK